MAMYQNSQKSPLGSLISLGRPTNHMIAFTRYGDEDHDIYGNSTQLEQFYSSTPNTCIVSIEPDPLPTPPVGGVAESYFIMTLSGDDANTVIYRLLDPLKSGNTEGLYLLSAKGTTWGSVGGTLSNQTDLQNALDAKASTSDLSGKVSKSGDTMTGNLIMSNTYMFKANGSGSYYSHLKSNELYLYCPYSSSPYSYTCYAYFGRHNNDATPPILNLHRFYNYSGRSYTNDVTLDYSKLEAYSQTYSTSSTSNSKNTYTGRLTSQKLLMQYDYQSGSGSVTTHSMEIAYDDIKKDGTSIIKTKTSQLTNDSNFVSDASYVHTDNNFTTAYKNSIDGLKDLAFIAKDGTSSTKYLRGDGTWQAFPTLSATWGSITGTLSNQQDLQNALNTKQGKGSPLTVENSWSSGEEASATYTYDGMYLSYSDGTSGYSQIRMGDTVLWTNSSPNASFTAQTITLSKPLTYFDYYVVYFRGGTSNEYYVYSPFMPIDQASCISYPAYFVVRRKFTPNSSDASKLAIEDAYKYSTYNSGSNSKQNSYLIPIKVIGWKFHN